MTKAELLNSLANHPDIRPYIGPGPEVLDLYEFFERPGNIMLGNTLGVVCFIAMGDGYYSVHFLFTKALRGRDALQAIRMAFTSLFTNYNCVAITGLIPHENRASRVMAYALGGRLIGECLDIHGRPSSSFIMERTRWVALSAES